MKKNFARFVIGVDPSGNFNEGKGHTGFAVYDRKTNKIYDTDMTYAGDYESLEAYFAATWEKLKLWIEFAEDQKCVVSMESYKMYAHKMKEQTWSEVETPQIIGYLRMKLYEEGIPLKMRPAVAVKKRWHEDVLVEYGYIEREGQSYYLEGQRLATHECDAIKHAIHCGKFELEDLPIE